MGRKILMGIWILLSVLSIIYGFIVQSAATGTAFFVIWFALGLVFAGFALAVKFGVWAKLPLLPKKLFLALVCVGLLCFVAVEACVISGFGKKGKDDLDYLIVLGAQVRKSGPSRVLKYRLDKAIEYLNENPDTVCIVSGGQGSNEHISEAQGMAEYLIANGISSERILLEDQSVSTAQNISNSKKLMEEGASVGIVTNDFHMFRALQIAKKQGLTNAYGIASESNRLYLLTNMVREFFAMIKFLIT